MFRKEWAGKYQHIQYVPKLSETSNPCSVCKSDYEDYLTVIIVILSISTANHINKWLNALISMLQSMSYVDCSRKSQLKCYQREEGRKAKKYQKMTKIQSTKHKAQSTKQRKLVTYWAAKSPGMIALYKLKPENLLPDLITIQFLLKPQ